MANAQLMRQVLAAGAAGFISKSKPSAALLKAIKVVLDGGIYTPDDLMDLEGQIVDGTMPKRPSLSRTQERVSAAWSTAWPTGISRSAWRSAKKP